MIARFAFVLLLGVAPTWLHAQTLSASIELASPNEEENVFLGEAISGAGDVNGDGFDDVIVGVRREGPGMSPENAGRAYVFSGDGGTLLYTLISPNEEAFGEFGISVSDAGDVNDDGFDDVIVGASFEDPGFSPVEAGRAYVFSGKNGGLLYTLVSPNEEIAGDFGFSVSNAGDVNNDGRPDLIVGATFETNGRTGQNGLAHVFSGSDGGYLYTLAVPPGIDSAVFGAATSGAGDVNSDGFADLIVGDFLSGPTGSPDDAGRAYVFNGKSRSLLYTLASPNEEEGGWFGATVSDVGDVNDDGFPDLLVGAPREDPGTSPLGSGRAYVFSGDDGALLYTLTSPNEEEGGNFGNSVSGVGDVNRDGAPDLLVGAPGEGPGPGPVDEGRAYVFSGDDGALLYTLVSPNGEMNGGFGGVSVAGDTNGDGVPDFMVGARQESPGGSPTNAGRAYIFSAPSLIYLYGPEGWATVTNPRFGDLDQLLNPVWTQGLEGASSSDGDPSVYIYSESGAGGDRNAGYVPADLFFEYKLGQGYLVYAFEDDDLLDPGIQGTFPKELPAFGPEATAATNSNGVSLPITFTESGNIDEDGWNLVGNPFSSSLDWDAPTWSKTNVDNAIYVYDPATTSYLTWNGATGSLGTGILATGQAFWAKSFKPNTELTAPPEGRVPGAQTQLYARNAPASTALPLVVGFSVSGFVGTTPRSNAAFVHFDETALTGADPLDAYELAPFSSTYLSLFTEDSDGTLRDILALPSDGDAPLGATVEVPLGVWAVADGQFTSAELTLTWPTLTLPDGWTATLLDTATGTEVDLLAASDYRFTATPGAQGSEAPDVLRGRTVREAPPIPTPLALDGIAAEGRRAAQRFVVTVAARGVSAEDGGTPLAFALDAAYPNPFTVQTTVAYTLAEASDVRLTVYDALGREVAVLADGRQVAGRHAASFDGHGLASGVYVVRLEAGGQTTTQQVILAR
ncbi:MAG: FG-GAP-like repeat-containing protein [Bacteroidota bacterium]